MEPIEFGAYLKNLRKQKGLTLIELSKISSVSQPHLSHIENGKRGIPSPDILKKIAKALDVPYLQIGIKAGHIPIDEWLMFELSRISKEGSIQFEHKQFLREVLDEFNIRWVTVHDSTQKIFEAIKKKEDPNLELSIFMKLHEYNASVNGLVNPEEIPKGMPHLTIAGSNLNTRREKSGISVLEAELLKKFQALSKEKQKIVLDLLQVMSSETESSNE